VPRLLSWPSLYGISSYFGLESYSCVVDFDVAVVLLLQNFMIHLGRLCILSEKNKCWLNRLKTSKNFFLLQVCVEFLRMYVGYGTIVVEIQIFLVLRTVRVPVGSFQHCTL
jgi:hypothetical protein